MDPAYAERIGVDVAIDSVAALVPKAELEATRDEQQFGLQARMMSKGLRKLAGHIREGGTTCLFTNQLREKVGVIYGPRETQPGGRVMKFYASQGLDMRPVETLKEGERSLSQLGCVSTSLVQAGAVKRSGPYFAFGDEKLGQGRAKAKATLEERPELVDQIAAEGKGLVGSVGKTDPDAEPSTVGEESAEHEPVLTAA